MRLKILIKDIEGIVVKGARDVDISTITSHSKTAAPGSLFVAKRGTKSDGNKYIREALQAGAVALLTDMYDPSFPTIVQIIHNNVLFVEAIIANRFYANPSDELCMVGITGTKGKTTTSFGIKHIFDKVDLFSGLIGTVEYNVGRGSFSADKTTPDSISNQRMLREMVKNGCLACVMEVSSHGLHQGRVSGINYDIAVFTNLSATHLDYHKTMEEYAKAKKLLFDGLTNEGVAIVNSDDPWAKYMVRDCKAEIFTFGLQPQADISASQITFESSGTAFQIKYQGKSIDFFWNLYGTFNVMNALAMLSVAIAKEIPLEIAVETLSSFTTVPGRLDRVRDTNGQPLFPCVFIDYAHCPDALEKVLEALQQYKKGKIITVFGCGGDRDKTMRPAMAKVAEQLSDNVIVTLDNPRTEDPDALIKDILVGFTKNDSFIVESDRKRAIEKAIDLAGYDDIVLIAGKGHEKKQYFAYYSVDFDDKEIAREYMHKVSRAT